MLSETGRKSLMIKKQSHSWTKKTLSTLYSTHLERYCIIMYTVGGGGFRRAVLDTMRRFTVVYRGILVRVCVRACVFSEQKFMSTLFISFIIFYFFFFGIRHTRGPCQNNNIAPSVRPVVCTDTMLRRAWGRAVTHSVYCTITVERVCAKGCDRVLKDPASTRFSLTALLEKKNIWNYNSCACSLFFQLKIVRPKNNRILEYRLKKHSRWLRLYRTLNS